MRLPAIACNLTHLLHRSELLYAFLCVIIIFIIITVSHGHGLLKVLCSAKLLWFSFHKVDT